MNNIDFVTFLVNEYDLEIDCDKCSDFYNLQAFFAYFDQTNRINKCFILSPLFNITSLCEYFLGLGADINAKSRYGATALHAAAVKNSKEMVQYLISLGAYVTLKDKDGSTPLHFAVAFNTIDVVRQLISCGADINAKDIRYRYLIIMISKSLNLFIHMALISMKEISKDYYF